MRAPPWGSVDALPLKLTVSGAEPESGPDWMTAVGGRLPVVYEMRWTEPPSRSA